MRWTEANYRRLVLDKPRGWGDYLLRSGLRLLSLPYAAAVKARNHAYDQGWLATQRVGVPVVSVGNLTVGGTGKTPVVEFLGHWFEQHGVNVTILSRGYGVQGGLNDEAMILAENLPHVPHYQGANRVALAKRALADRNVDLFLLDDGFQHRRLGRELDIVLLDALYPFGGGWQLPGGLLREPVSALARAQAVVLTRADMIASAERRRLRAAVEALAGEVPYVEMRFVPVALQRYQREPESPGFLRGRRVLAFCGIGNPESFWQSLRGWGVNVMDSRVYPDHHAYSANDRADLAKWVHTHLPEAVLTTQKDLVKYREGAIGGVPLFAARIHAEPMSGWEDLLPLLERVSQRARPARTEVMVA